MRLIKTRLILLNELDRDGILDNLTYQQIGDLFGINRATAYRSLRDVRDARKKVPEMKEKIRDMIAIIPDKKRAGFKVGDKVKFLSPINADGMSVRPGQFGIVAQDSDKGFVLIERKGKIIICQFDEVRKTMTYRKRVKGA